MTTMAAAEEEVETESLLLLAGGGARRGRLNAGNAVAFHDPDALPHAVFMVPARFYHHYHYRARDNNNNTNKTTTGRRARAFLPITASFLGEGEAVGEQEEGEEGMVEVRMERGDPTLMLELEVGAELNLRPVHYYHRRRRGVPPALRCIIDTVCVRSRGRCARVGLRPVIIY